MTHTHTTPAHPPPRTQTQNTPQDGEITKKKVTHPHPCTPTTPTHPHTPPPPPHTPHHHHLPKPQDGEITEKNVTVAAVGKDLPFMMLEDEALLPYITGGWLCVVGGGVGCV